MNTTAKTVAAPYEVLDRGTRILMPADEAEARRAEFLPPRQQFMSIGPAGDGMVLVKLTEDLVLTAGATVILPAADEAVDDKPKGRAKK